MQTTLWLQALSFPVFLYHCWATVGPSKLMQAFIRLWDSWQPWPPGYSNSVILDKAKSSPCLGHFCRGWSRYGAMHDKEVPHLDGWNWVLNTYIVVISYFLSMLLKGWWRWDAAAGKQEMKDWLEPLAWKSFSMCSCSLKTLQSCDAPTARKSVTTMESCSKTKAAKLQTAKCKLLPATWHQRTAFSIHPDHGRFQLIRNKLSTNDRSDLLSQEFGRDYWLVRTLLNFCQQLPSLARKDVIKLCHKDLLLQEAI